MANLKNHPGMWLRDDAAAAINALEDKYGVIIINSAGRTEAEQQDMIDRWDRGDRDGLFNPARPAYTSSHVKNGGEAVDVYNYTDDRAKLNEFGFQWYGTADPVHYTFTGWSGGGAPANVGAGQRTAGPNGVRRRSQPTSQSAEAGDALTPGTVGNFTGWTRGENVEGNDVWYQGISGNWFWSGGFVEGANGTGIADLNPQAPAPASNQRTVVPTSGANGRSGPSTANPVVQTLDPGTVGTFNGWTKGEAVEGVDTWFRGAFSGNWFWAGGFTSQSTDGLEQVGATAPPTPTPTPTNADNPRGLPTATPVYPGAAFGLVAPLGDGERGFKGEDRTVVPKIIDRYIIHHTGVTNDQLDYFSYKNGGSSCPTWYLRTSGAVIELIRPGMKPASTGPEWNWRSVAVETLNETGAPDYRVTDAQLEAHAQMIAWLASYDGKVLDGIPVSFKIDREHVITDRETRATICPGPYLQGKVDGILVRARAIFAEKYAPVIVPDPEPDPDPTPEPSDSQFRAFLAALMELIKKFLGGGA